MKAITLIQPYATLIALGYKTNETRSWSTTHRGLLAIHAGLGQPSWAREAAENDPVIAAILERHGLTFATLPRGRVLAVADVAGMRRIVSVVHANSPHEVAPSQLTPEEHASGDYTPGRWAWQLRNVQVLKEPTACSGAQSIWLVPADIALRIESTAKAAPVHG